MKRRHRSPAPSPAPARYREIAEPVGKGFTKKLRVRFEPAQDGDVSEVEMWKRLLVGNSGSLALENVDAIRTWAGEELERRGLPHSPWVSYDRKKQPVPSSDRMDPRFGHANLRAYISAVRGFAHDSPEAVLARIIEAADGIQRRPEAALRSAFALGEAWTEWRLYGFQRKSGGQARRGDADPLIARVSTLMAEFAKEGRTFRKRADAIRALQERGVREKEKRIRNWLERLNLP